ncbi:hypothetical protein B0T19DRAFT_420873 [Cercophora scortea]|uniref:RING finger domain-containing protein n=1 Tax=Cercophora scortea TaxID=314031 RepID=A0AAE0MC49_9PEZI|nr:hypothetical protein B0T19DRAFT_420873 [Cercophora scortea]
MADHLEDIPPPPYSETDLFSTAGQPRSPTTSDYRRGSHGDAATQSSTSTNGDVIYTPPLTPRSSSHQSNFANDVDHISTSSANAYFETRPAPPPLQSRPQIVHSITVKDSTSPDSLPYPAELGERDVRPGDWQTFVNYLIPHYSSTSNEQIIDRKLRAERSSSRSNSNSNDDARSHSSGQRHAEAQLDQLRTADPLPDATQRRQTIDATTREWNDGFFAPRRITVRLTTHDEELHIPGAWNQSFDQAESGAARGDAAGPSRSPFARFRPPFGGPDSRGGFRFGGIALDGGRVMVGENIVADRNGLRIGGLVADANGISVNGTPMFGGPSQPRGSWPPPGPPGGGWGFGRGGPWGRGGRGGPCGGPMGIFGPEGEAGGHHPERGFGRFRGRWENDGGDRHERGFGRIRGRFHDGSGDRHGRGRGRHRHHDGHEQQSRSSSVSSSSSSSSSSSESSVGSLPDSTELRDAQLPLAKQYLESWLSNPAQPVTKEKVKQLKEQIKAAKKSGPNQSNGINEPANIAFDQAELRKEVKGLMKDWKALKRQQAKLKRQLKRERRQKNRAEKQERRNQKREMKRAARDLRRSGRGSNNNNPEQDHPPASIPGPFPFFNGPNIPGVPGPGNGNGNGPFQPHFPMGMNMNMNMGPGMMNPFPFNPWSGNQPPPPNPFSTNNNNPNAPPGSWPTTPNTDPTTAPPRASQTKRQAAEEVEAQVIQKEAELVQLHETIAREQEEHELELSRNRGVEADGKTPTSPSARELETMRMEQEVERLARDMVRLRTEADEEFARELAEEENAFQHGQEHGQGQGGSSLRGGQVLGGWLRGWV